jgi:hypothetical protein
MKIAELTDPVVGFRNFTWLAWKALGLPDPAPIQQDVADYLATGPSRRIVTAMRGFGKSYLTATYTAWRLYCNPDTTVLCISAAQTRAREFTRLTRQLLSQMECCHWLIPNENDRDGADRFDVGARTTVSKDPSVAAYGITSMITGTHVDLIICDDVETPDNSKTVENRDKLLHKLTELPNILNPGGQIVMLGTPQTEDSIYLRLAQTYDMCRWPARAPRLDDEKRCERLAPYIGDRLQSGAMEPGDSTYPEYYPHEELLERETVMGPSVFALQFLLDTTLADLERYPLKLQDFIVYDCAHTRSLPRNISWSSTETRSEIASVGIGRDFFKGPGWVDNEVAEAQDSVMFIDPSGRGADQTGYCVARLLNGLIFIPEAGGLEGGHDEPTLMKLAEIAHRHGIKRVLVESNFGDGMYSKLLTPILSKALGGVTIEEVRVGGQQKERRILESLEPPLAAHRIVIDPEVARNSDLMTQVSRLTNERGCLRHDDQVDALAGAVSHFKDRLSLDVAQEIERQEKQLLEGELREFERGMKKGGIGREVVLGHMHPDVVVPPRKRSRGFAQKLRWGRQRRR